MKPLLLRALDRCLSVDDADPDTALGLARIVGSGVVLLAVGIGMAVSSYVRHGFKWPADRSDWGRDV